MYQYTLHVVVRINTTAQQDVCASTVHYSSHIHHHYYQNSQTPNGLSKKSHVRTGNASDLHTAGVCFIQEEPHNIPCIMNRGERIQLLLEPVSFDHGLHCDY